MSILDSFSRLSTQVVEVGDLGIGGGNPIRLQSMTSTDTLDIEKTVTQTIRLVEAGCELVRITVPNMKAVIAIEKIKNRLRQQNINTPLVADVHFSKKVAEAVAPIVEKIRINPGNYLDKKKFIVVKYSDSEYANELSRIAENFSPLVEICKRHQTAMRIGTNHGSLSDRIVNRYGDSPVGMVESALEFVDICEKHDFYQIVLSMKSSNTLVMVAAYRLLVSKLQARGKIYPLHLGVTEAGADEDGRVKSAAGIGTLLSDGIGDTIRVSLTEEPQKEIPVCQAITRYIGLLRTSKKNGLPFDLQSKNNEGDVHDFIRSFAFIESSKKNTLVVGQFGGKEVPKVCTTLNSLTYSSPSNVFFRELMQSGYQKLKESGKWNANDVASDAFFLDITKNDFSSLMATNHQPKNDISFHQQFDLPLNTTLIIPFDVWKIWQQEKFIANKNHSEQLDHRQQIICFGTLKEYRQQIAYFMEDVLPDLAQKRAIVAVKITLNDWSEIQKQKNIFHNNTLLIVSPTTNHPSLELRNFILHLRNLGITNPCLISLPSSYYQNITEREQRQIVLALIFAPLLIDNLIQGIHLQHGELKRVETTGFGNSDWPNLRNDLSADLSNLFAILQATRRRISRTEYISCPSCGRTLFDLQEVTTKIKKRTEHLKGVKIAVMGCIVNGPGEMADADFGYVGSGIGKITLYKGKEVVKRGIPAENAIDELIELIKDNGVWVEPENPFLDSKKI